MITFYNQFVAGSAMVWRWKWGMGPVNYKLTLACQLQIGTCWEHLPASEEQQQGHLPSVCAAAAADLWHFLKGIQCGEWGTLCSRETGVTGL